MTILVIFKDNYDTAINLFELISFMQHRLEKHWTLPSTFAKYVIYSGH